MKAIHDLCGVLRGIWVRQHQRCNCIMNGVGVTNDSTTPLKRCNYARLARPPPLASSLRRRPLLSVKSSCAFAAQRPLAQGCRPSQHVCVFGGGTTAGGGGAAATPCCSVELQWWSCAPRESRLAQSVSQSTEHQRIQPDSGRHTLPAKLSDNRRYVPYNREPEAASKVA